MRTGDTVAGLQVIYLTTFRQKRRIQFALNLTPLTLNCEGIYKFSTKTSKLETTRRVSRTLD